jgi:hypothetical protein
MRRDLETAAKATPYEPLPGYSGGSYKGIALVAPRGRAGANALQLAEPGTAYEKTRVLRSCPYFDRIIEGLACPVERVRLLRLEPGSKVRDHREPGDGWALGRVRLQIPIVTNDRVVSLVSGRRVDMRPGELWYCDSTRTLRVHNRGSEARVHMVLDVQVDDWLKALFPAEPLVDRVYGWAQRAVYFAPKRARELARAAWTPS